MIMVSAKMFGENRFIYEEECRRIFKISKSRRRKMIIKGEFPAMREESDGVYGWLAEDLAEYLVMKAHNEIFNLYPDRYGHMRPHSPDESSECNRSN